VTVKVNHFSNWSISYFNFIEAIFSLKNMLKHSVKMVLQLLTMFRSHISGDPVGNSLRWGKGKSRGCLNLILGLCRRIKWISVLVQNHS